MAAVLCFLFEFPARRYHATPWGHHVNEGLVEWPPSPWRIVRALLAVGHTKLGWEEVPDEMRALIEDLSATLPEYRLPPATLGHTRHFMPIKGWKRGVQKTSMVIDAFVRPHGALGVFWRIDSKPGQRELVTRLLARLGYLGRAESRVKARLVASVAELPECNKTSAVRQGPDDEPIRLLAPVPKAEYDKWRRAVSGAPCDLLGALQTETMGLQRGGWSAPPGSREIIYWRPADALSPPSADRVRTSGAVVSADTALFALATDRQRDVLPQLEHTLPTMALFRRALLSKLGSDPCPELSGKDAQGQPLRDAHLHAHFIPLSLDPRNMGRIDHVLVYCPMGFGRVAQRALRSLRKTWAKGIDDIAVTLIGMAGRPAFRLVTGEQTRELGNSLRWESRTPFIPPRFLKPHGKDSLEGQVRVELRHRHLPDIVGAPVITLPTDQGERGRQARWFRHFVRTRQNTRAPEAPPGVFHLTLTFERPVPGPLCLGWGSHFGLGVFVPTEATPGGAI